jgi:hypothetical protein
MFIESLFNADVVVGKEVRLARRIGERDITRRERRTRRELVIGGIISPGARCAVTGTRRHGSRAS